MTIANAGTDQPAGTVAEYDTPNWSATLQKLAQQVFGPRLRFPVTGTPANPQDITVLIDGQPVSATQGASVWWSYNATNHTIDFSPLVAPNTGSVVQIQYPSECVAP